VLIRSDYCEVCLSIVQRAASIQTYMVTLAAVGDSPEVSRPLDLCDLCARVLRQSTAFAAVDVVPLPFGKRGGR
jgi:hypothetical protein